MGKIILTIRGRAEIKIRKALPPPTKAAGTRKGKKGYDRRRAKRALAKGQ